MAYALSVCPYLSSDSYRSNIRPLIPALEARLGTLLVDNTMLPRRPDVFVAVMSYGQSVNALDGDMVIRPLRPYHAIEFWSRGKQLEFVTGLDTVRRGAQRMSADAPQPAPTPNAGTPIWDLVIADMKGRDALGLRKYRTRLQANNGRDALLDAYHEALDLCVYLRQAIEERKLAEPVAWNPITEMRQRHPRHAAPDGAEGKPR